MTSYVHPTAIIETGVVIGVGTSIWDNVFFDMRHRHPASFAHSLVPGLDRLHRRNRVI